MPSPRPGRAPAPEPRGPDPAPSVAPDPVPAAPAAPASAPAAVTPAPEHVETEPEPRRSSTGYLGALWIIAPLMPGLAAVVTVGTYLFLPTLTGVEPPTPPAYPGLALIAGLGATALVWFGGAFLAKALVSAPRAQLRLYAELLERTRSLRDRSSTGTPVSPEDHPAAEEARTHVAYATEELEGEGAGPALRWALASGYMSVLRALHRADEALIIVEPTDAAVGDALHDALSLEGSAIGNRERLIDIVRISMHRLSPGSAVSFMAAVTGAPANDAERINEKQAREALREVRHALNEFRDDRHEGLIRARNRLIWTMLAVGVTTYLLLSLALVAGVSVKHIQTAAILYLVGAIVGLFNRLRIEAGQSSAVEDFGLSQARLVVTPLVSGLAAVAGVYLIAALPVLLPNGSEPPATAPVLSEVFDLATNSMALIYAAIFGLAPSTLTSRLSMASARLEKDLQSTEAASPSAASDDTGGVG
jgi:hypothetical protein